MAAPPANLSPSNKDVQQDVQQNIEEKSSVGSANAATSNTATVPDDNEEKCVTKELPTYESSESSEYYSSAKKFLTEGDFEQALSKIVEGIEETQAFLSSLNIESDLHESMAPYHYLYGTTLLYSIEESNDVSMTVGAAVARDSSSEGDEGQEANAEINVDDMEIAWENLEAARKILTTLLTKDTNEERELKLKLDLAQTYLREGDLQRMNSRYPEAIEDYKACLELRMAALSPYDRKIADAQYNLGLSYLSNSTEMQKEEPDHQHHKIIQEHCLMGIKKYTECAKTLCGQIAIRCGVEPDSVLDVDSKKGGFKTTGMKEDAIASSEASNLISLWRKNISSLSPLDADDYLVEDLRQLLDEIQETVDEAQSSQDAIRQAVALKLQAQQDADKDSLDGNTKIGFDAPTLSDLPKTGNQPMMVVKKKKKRETPSDGCREDPGKKRAKSE